MKATGIVRRIDDLGRVVIPKAIRRTMRIREGDPLEIYTAGDGEVIFKKYSPIGELHSLASQYAASAVTPSAHPEPFTTVSGKNTGSCPATTRRSILRTPAPESTSATQTSVKSSGTT